MSAAIAAAMLLGMELFLGIIFAISSASKLRNPAAFVEIIEGLGLHPVLAKASAIVVIATEASISLMLLASFMPLQADVLAVALLLVFFVMIGGGLARGKRVACGCFGNPGERASIKTLARIVGLAALAAGSGLGRFSGSYVIPILSTGPSQWLVGWTFAFLYLVVGFWALSGRAVAKELQ